MTSTRWTTTDGLQVHARVWDTTSSSPPVVLVHGLVVASGMVAPTAERLAGRYPVYAPDLPGFGDSDKPRRALRISELAEVLASWQDANGLAQAVVVGNSLGCQIVVDAAMRFPHTVRAVVLAAPTVDPEARSWPVQLWRWRKEQSTQSGSMRLLQLRDYAKAKPWRGYRTFQQALGDRVEDKLPYVEQPTLVVHGTRDPLLPEAWGARLAGLAPQGQLRVLPGVVHAMAYENPLELSRVVDRFVKDVIS